MSLDSVFAARWISLCCSFDFILDVSIGRSTVDLTLVTFFMSNVFGPVGISVYNSFLAVRLSLLYMSHSLEFCLLDDQIDSIFRWSTGLIWKAQPNPPLWRVHSGTANTVHATAGAIEISRQFSLHLDATFLADLTWVSFMLKHLDNGPKAYSMSSIGGTNDKAGEAWNSTTLREKIAPALSTTCHIVADGFSFNLYMSFTFSGFDCLDIWVDECWNLGWLEFMTCSFAAKFCDLVQILETLTTLPP